MDVRTSGSLATSATNVRAETLSGRSRSQLALLAVGRSSLLGLPRLAAGFDEVAQPHRAVDQLHRAAARVDLQRVERLVVVADDLLVIADFAGLLIDAVRGGDLDGVAARR